MSATGKSRHKWRPVARGEDGYSKGANARCIKCGIYKAKRLTAPTHHWIAYAFDPTALSGDDGLDNPGCKEH